MEDYSISDHFNPSTHEGVLPVRVLQFNMLKWFEEVSPTLLEEVLGEVNYRGLQRGIGYHIAIAPITDAAEIDGKKKIHLYENYLQFLWGVSYAITTLFQEGFVKPVKAGTYTGVTDLSDPFVRKAYAVFDASIELFTKCDPSKHYALPNPEKETPLDVKLIRQVNGVFSAASAFILMHEVGHQFFGHLDDLPVTDDYLKDKGQYEDEFAADDYALEWLQKGKAPSDVLDDTNAMGVIAAMTTFLLMDPQLTGDDEHPPPHMRMTHALEELGTTDENLWACACIGLRLWAAHTKYSFTVPSGDDLHGYKDLFYIVVDKMTDATGSPAA